MHISCHCFHQIQCLQNKLILTFILLRFPKQQKEYTHILSSALKTSTETINFWCIYLRVFLTSIVITTSIFVLSGLCLQIHVIIMWFCATKTMYTSTSVQITNQFACVCFAFTPMLFLGDTQPALKTLPVINLDIFWYT